MILGVELAFTVLGIIALIRGRWPMGKKGYLTGKEAKNLGIIAVCTLPVIFAFAFVMGIIMAIAMGPEVVTSSPWYGIGVEAVGLILWGGFLFYKQAEYARTGKLVQNAQQKKS